MPGTIQQALGGLARLMGYSERSVLLSAHGLVSVGALLLPAAAAVLLAGAALGWHWLCGSGARILQKL